MVKTGWRVVCVLPSELPVPTPALSFVNDLPTDWEDWLAAGGTPAGTPFLLDPKFGYDIALNAFSALRRCWGPRGTPRPATRGTWLRS